MFTDPQTQQPISRHDFRSGGPLRPRVRFANARRNQSMAATRADGLSAKLAAAALAGALVIAVSALSLALSGGAARAADVSQVVDAVTDSFCQISQEFTTQTFKLPEIGGLLTSSSGSIVEGRTMGTARYTGTVEGPDTSFAVDIKLEGRLDPGDPGYGEAAAGAELAMRCGASTEGWHYYSSLRGTLRGIGADDFNGAVYNLSLDEGFAQVGYAADTHTLNWGVFARIIFELADPVAYPNLPAGPFAGEMAFKASALKQVYQAIASATPGEPLDLMTVKDYLGYAYILPQSAFPKPSPELTGTWEGTIECAGLTDAVASQTISGPLLLKVGTQWGWNYPVELSQTVDGVDVLDASYCAQYSADFGRPGNGSGQMTSAAGEPSEVFVKVNQQPGLMATLKARGLIYTPDGPDADQEPDGLSICKWTFTRIDTATPQVATACTSGVIVTP